MPAFKDLSGRSFGAWLVLSYAGTDGSGATWMCVCECGTERSVKASSLLGGRSTACGCTRDVAKWATHHGHQRGGKQSPTYQTWRAMLRRCSDPGHPSYLNYGGRGVGVCDEWKTFERFLSDMGERPEGTWLDRIDCDGDYCKSNCRWLSTKLQGSNRRNNVFYEMDGKRLTVPQWAELLGAKEGTIRARLRRGKSIEEALRR